MTEEPKVVNEVVFAEKDFEIFILNDELGIQFTEQDADCAYFNRQEAQRILEFIQKWLQGDQR